MSNFKKVLAMVLAVMMVMALMTTAFAAEAKALDYSDSSFQDEAMLLNELGIIVGGDSGAWDAERLVTRGEFTKMICVAMNGGVDNPALYTGDNSTGLTDIDGHWAKGYIIYCFKLGIIAGVGDGTFSPNTSVTGVQAAKILLTALGYDAVKEGYVNVADWELNINVKAGEIALYEGFGAAYDPRQPLSRDFAAKMIANAFDAFMVYYDQNINVQRQSLTFAQSRLRLRTVEGVLVSNEYASVIYDQDGNAVSGLASEGESKVSYKSVIDGNFHEAVIPLASNVDDLGKSVKVYVRYKTGYSLINSYGQLNDYAKDAVEKIFGSIAVTAKNVVYKTAKGFGTYSGASPFSDYVSSNKLRIPTGTSGFALQVNYGVTAGTDYFVGSSASTDAFQNYLGSTPIFKGDTLTLIDNDNDRRIDYAFLVRDEFAEVTRYDTSAEKLGYEVGGAARVAIDFEDVIGIEDIELGDWILISKLNESEIYIVKAIEPITGTLTGNTSAAGQDVAIISGSNYQFAKNMSSGYPANGKGATWSDLNVAGNYGSELTYWVDSNNYILRFKGVDPNNYCVITDSGARLTQNVGDPAAMAVVSVLASDGSSYNGYTLTSVEVAAGTTVRSTAYTAGIKYWDASKKYSSANVDNDIIIEMLGLASANGSAPAYTTTPGNAAGMVFAYNVDTEAKTIELRKVPDSFTYTGSTGPSYSNNATISIAGGLGESYNVNDNSAFFIFNNATGVNKWLVYKGRTAVPVLNSARYTGLGTWTGYVVNSARPNETQTVGAISLEVDDATMRSTERYVIVATTPSWDGSGSSRTVTFQGVYLGETATYTGTVGNNSTTINSIARGNVLTFDGSAENFMNVTIENVNNTDRYFAGHIVETSTGIYTIGFTPDDSDSSWIPLAVKSGTTNYTHVDGSTLSSATGFGKFVTDTTSDWNKNSVVAVRDNDDTVTDMVYFAQYLSPTGRAYVGAPGGGGGGITLNLGDLLRVAYDDGSIYTIGDIEGGRYILVASSTTAISNVDLATAITPTVLADNTDTGRAATTGSPGSYVRLWIYDNTAQATSYIDVKRGSETNTQMEAIRAVNADIGTGSVSQSNLNNATGKTAGQTGFASSSSTLEALYQDYTTNATADSLRTAAAITQMVTEVNADFFADWAASVTLANATTGANDLFTDPTETKFNIELDAVNKGYIKYTGFTFNGSDLDFASSDKISGNSAVLSSATIQDVTLTTGGTNSKAYTLTYMLYIDDDGTINAGVELSSGPYTVSRTSPNTAQAAANAAAAAVIGELANGSTTITYVNNGSDPTKLDIKIDFNSAITAAATDADTFVINYGPLTGLTGVVADTQQDFIITITPTQIQTLIEYFISNVNATLTIEVVSYKGTANTAPASIILTNARTYKGDLKAVVDAVLLARKTSADSFAQRITGGNDWSGTVAFLTAPSGADYALNSAPGYTVTNSTLAGALTVTIASGNVMFTANNAIGVADATVDLKVAGDTATSIGYVIGQLLFKLEDAS